MPHTPKTRTPLQLAGDRVFYLSPPRYRRLVTWMRTALKAGCTEADVIAALTTYAAKPLPASDDWWPYLTKIVGNAAARRREAEAEAAKRKESENAGEFAGALMKMAHAFDRRTKVVQHG